MSGGARQLQNYLLWWLEQQHLHQLTRQAPTDPFGDLPEEPWMAEGRCAKSAMPEAWFPPKGGNRHHADTKMALRICRGCPVREACLEYALAHPVEGIWGATTTDDRRQIRYRRDHAG